MTPRRFKCIQFHEGTFNFSLECIQLLQNDFFKQRYITFNATISGQDRIYPLVQNLFCWVYNERQKSCTTFHFHFFWFKTDYFKFKYYSDDVLVLKDYFCYKFECPEIHRHFIFVNNVKILIFGMNFS